MENWLYSAAYLLLMTGAGGVCVALGFLFPPRLARESRPDLAWDLALRFGMGLSVLSWIAVWAGLMGQLRGHVLWPALIVPACVGAWIGGREIRNALARNRQGRDGQWAALNRPERILAGAAGILLALLFLNFLIGGLLPDTGMDSMWYHLTVPGQWVATGRVDTFPFCMPSNYALAMESVYASLLLVSDEVLCVSFYSLVTLVLYAATVILVWRWVGLRGAVLAAAVCIPFYATVNSVAPLGAVNINTMALLLLLAFGELFGTFRASGAGVGRVPGSQAGVSGAGDRQDRDVAPSLSRAGASGFLLGSAVAAKLIALPFGAVVGFLFLFGLLRGGAKFRKALACAGLVLSFSLLAYLPWAVRGLLGSGNPFFPLFSDLFPVRDAYSRSLEISRSLNGVFALNLAGLQEAFFEGLPGKLGRLTTNLDVVFWLLLISLAGTTVTRAGRFWNLQALMAALFFFIFFWIKGANEVGRYFAAAYPLAIPLISRFLDRLLQSLRPAARYSLIIVLVSTALFTYGKKQWRVANFHTIQWRFTPVVSMEERRRFALNTEGGGHYLLFETMRSQLEPDAYVFMPQTWYAYYMKRRALWNLGDSWLQMSPAQAVDYVRQGGFDYCFFEDLNDPRVVALRESGVVQPVEFPGHDGHPASGLYRVNKDL